MSAHDMDEGSISGRSVSAAPDVLKQELPDDETIFLNLRTESYFGLDPVGTAMYRALVESPTIDAALDRLTRQFDADPERLRADLDALLRRLLDQGLVQLDASA